MRVSEIHPEHHRHNLLFQPDVPRAKRQYGNTLYLYLLQDVTFINIQWRWGLTPNTAEDEWGF